MLKPTRDKIKVGSKIAYQGEIWTIEMIKDSKIQHITRPIEYGTSEEYLQLDLNSNLWQPLTHRVRFILSNFQAIADTLDRGDDNIMDIYYKLFNEIIVDPENNVLLSEILAKLNKLR